MKSDELKVGNAYRVKIEYKGLTLEFRDCLVMIDKAQNETIWGCCRLVVPFKYIEAEKV